ncbi:unnamed protein product [Staurois parvus]|uniref:Uncharacterized protein n=1 Tax=Staurois parvus TaxID=386267 RepID=A0ABN9AWG8_9NEOB|nr:unnamed protein product [Staurois parvus]
MGPRTDSSCCCQARNLSWAPVPPLLMLLPGPECVMGPCTASHCCCLHRHTLPCATFRSPHTDRLSCCATFHSSCLHAARPVILPPMGPCTDSRLLMGCCHAAPECVMGPCTASHCCCPPSPHSAMCHFQVSSHCWVGSILS